MNGLARLAGSTARSLLLRLDESKCRRLTPYDIGGFDRIYHVHIRKTGGQSLNQMFLPTIGSEAESTMRRLTWYHRLVIEGKVFATGDQCLINGGHYYYAFSHAPLHGLRLPEKTFIYTCLRDPVARVISHYRMLMDFRSSGAPHACMKTEGPWLGDCFDDFVAAMPREHLLNQLYMFSKTFDVNEAFGRIVSCSYYFFMEDFDEGVRQLNERLGLQLQRAHIGRSRHEVQVSPEERERLRERLSPEYELVERLRAG
jgi:hypothetical protein